MKITLISISDFLPTDGIRLVSALLKNAGHEVFNVFFPAVHFERQRSGGFQPLMDLLSRCDMAMFSVYSAFSHKSAILTRRIHDDLRDMPVVWGGPHCISAPELSLRHADAVCYGEADRCIVEYVNSFQGGNPHPEIGNMAYSIDSYQRINPPLPPFEDLDSLPYLDYGLENHFLLEHDLYPMSKELMRQRFSDFPFGIPTFSILTSRGCPHACAYCNNTRYVSLFGKNRIRKQSVGRFMAELESVVSEYPYFRGVLIGDDDFFIRSEQELEEFAARYKSNVRLPFEVGASNTTFRKKKLDFIIDCGLKIIEIGIQSASRRILADIYNRNLDPAKTADIAKTLEPYWHSHRLRTYIDFLTDNPYETPDDVAQTYRYMVKLPVSSLIHLHNLVFFPGTPIYSKAVADGIIKPNDETEFGNFGGNVRYQFNYELFLCLVAGTLSVSTRRFFIPRGLLLALGSNPVRFFMNLLPQGIYRSLVNFMNSKYLRSQQRKRRDSPTFGRNPAVRLYSIILPAMRFAGRAFPRPLRRMLKRSIFDKITMKIMRLGPRD